MSEWKKTYLRDLIVIKNGKDHKKLKNGPYPVYGSGGIMRYADSYLYDQESVLLPRKGTLNNIQFVTEPFWTVDTCYYTVVNRDKVLPYFLYCCLCKMDIQSLNTGSAVPSMTFEKYYSIEVPIPPLSTQHCIANILSRYDSLIENYQKQIKLLEEAAQRLYKEWFIDLHFPRHENTNIIDGVPEGWEKKKLIDLVDVQYGYAFDGHLFNSKGEGTPIVRIRNIPDGCTSDYTTEEANDSYIVNDGDILIGMDGIFHINTWCGGKSYLVQRACSFRPKNVSMKGFILQAIYEPIKFFENTVVGATVAHLGKKHIDSIELLVSNDDKMYKPFEKMFNERQTLKTQLRLLTEARDRLLPKLISGEITV